MVVMLKRITTVIFGVAAVAVLNVLAALGPTSDQSVNKTTGVTASEAADAGCFRASKGLQAGDILADIQNLAYRGYSIQKLHKQVRADVPPEYGKSPLVDVSYAAISRRGKIIRKLDSGIFFILGNTTEMGFFSFLGDGRKQLIVSQDVPKGGCQWVVDFDQQMRVIFDGQEFAVGREAYDMAIADLDGDQISEIIVPICEFYGFEQGRLTTMETPLPGIVFKYDGDRYLPANVILKNCLLKNIEQGEREFRSLDKHEVRLGDLMSITLDYIFVGEEQRGWKFFEETCKLPDKAKIKSDMQEVLKTHPVYRYIYKQRANR
jgi:hypothetical protein